jgi:hypothetical protein
VSRQTDAEGDSINGLATAIRRPGSSGVATGRNHRRNAVVPNHGRDRNHGDAESAVALAKQIGHVVMTHLRLTGS